MVLWIKCRFWDCGILAVPTRSDGSRREGREISPGSFPVKTHNLSSPDPRHPPTCSLWSSFQFQFPTKRIHVCRLASSQVSANSTQLTLLFKKRYKYKKMLTIFLSVPPHLQIISFRVLPVLAHLVGTMRDCRKGASLTHFPNSPWNWAPGILSFLPARLFPPLPWWSLIWGRWQLGCRPTPQEQGEGAEPSGQSLRQQGGNWFYHWPCQCLELASPWKGKV